MATRDELDAWLRDYGAAWEARDGDRAASLFAEDGVYCWGPHEWSSFSDSSGKSRVELDGVFVLDFGDDGLCEQLQEWWLARETRTEG